MNVIFLDIDGVLCTVHKSTNEDIKNKVEILSNICKTYNTNIVIESSHKDQIDMNLYHSDVDWLNYILYLFKEYNINLIGSTKTIGKKINNIYIPFWKEDEIRYYLYQHLDINHYAIIDDDDYNDLNKVKNHLVKTIMYSNNCDEEGLLLKHKEEIGKVLSLDNDIKSLVLRHRKCI